MQSRSKTIMQRVRSCAERALKIYPLKICYRIRLHITEKKSAEVKLV